MARFTSLPDSVHDTALQYGLPAVEQMTTTGREEALKRIHQSGTFWYPGILRIEAAAPTAIAVASQQPLARNCSAKFKSKHSTFGK